MPLLLPMLLLQLLLLERTTGMRNTLPWVLQSGALTLATRCTEELSVAVVVKSAEPIPLRLLAGVAVVWCLLRLWEGRKGSCSG